MATVAPVTRDVAELIGGPRDGDLFDLGGLGPLDHLVVPLPRLPATLRIDPSETYPTAASVETARYRRGTISDASHRWRYVYEG